MSTLETVKEILTNSNRSELRDHAFGDREVYWGDSSNNDVAEAYIGSSGTYFAIEYDGIVFYSNDRDVVRELVKLGTLTNVERNDSTGPDDYQEGVVLPGLTLEGVYNELTDE